MDNNRENCQLLFRSEHFSIVFNILMFHAVSSEQSKQETRYPCVVHECQLRQYRQVARYLEVNTAHQVVSIKDNLVWRKQRGHPQILWLAQRLVQRNPQGWRHRVGNALLTYAPTIK